MTTKLILASLMLAFAGGACAAGTITVYPGNSAPPLTVTGAERLADLVTQPTLAHSWWPGTVISERQSTAVAEQQHQKLLARLAALAADRGGDEGAAINGLRTQLQAIRVTGRQLVNLDPDRVRVNPESNPPLLGEYSLWVGQKPTTVTVMGLVSTPGKKTFAPGRSVDEYLDDVSTLSGGDRSYAWVVYPDGKTVKAPVAYWNKRHVEPMPGSIIFVGFADHIFSSAWDGLNEQILHSLTHRIPD
ncbi:capsule biosynthesis GfcC family protein [Enterobacteriaceae bacterium BIT-l23]|jgi:hypothetical protein|uniref:capsule biosynthesis GfcC family protein n=1 Tax=Jejubacter sp. L23 TaxID=3092086 RepID=UPI001584AFFB|nr:capsule biosynthesis GfcC family protein [Enterobacteriaceae bacterium BIT-l23]